MKTKKLKSKYKDYCQSYLLSLLAEADNLKETLEDQVLDLMAKQQLIEDQISDLENKIEEIKEALSAE